MSLDNLRALYAQADTVDRREGKLAYRRYHEVLTEIASVYMRPFPLVVAAFVAMSPNSDYYGNLRSLITVLKGLREGVDPARITVSTYEHCRGRAIAYLEGSESFMDHAKGLKTRNFYCNIMIPQSPHYVTIDGHMMAAWTGKNMTMSEAKVTPRVYRKIAEDITTLAAEAKLLPCQMQATLWFARKRTEIILFNPQGDIFHGHDDQWRTRFRLAMIPPYEFRPAASTGPLV